MDSTDKEIRYSLEKRGVCEEIYENVEGVDFVSASDGDSNVLLIKHDDSRSNTVIENVELLFSVTDIKTV